MQRVNLPHTDLTVSPICLGAGGFGTGVQAEAIDRLVGAFRDGGGNFLDTAHCYGFWAAGGAGASERAIGEYLRRSGRGDLVVATKGGHPARAGYERPDGWLSPRQLAADIADSLRWLGVECIDLYWLHRDDLRLPVGEVIEALNGHVAAGRIRYLGASNWTTARIAASNRYAAAHGLHGFVASQVEWNLACRSVPHEQRPHGDACIFLEGPDREYHRQTGLPLLAYTSTACGYFASSGKLAAATYDNPTSRSRLERARSLAADLHATVNQVALAWLINQPHQTIPIVGTASVEHLRDALPAADLRLTAEQVAWLEGS